VDQAGEEADGDEVVADRARSGDDVLWRGARVTRSGSCEVGAE
jgi:hypothetical protein